MYTCTEKVNRLALKINKWHKHTCRTCTWNWSWSWM